MKNLNLTTLLGRFLTVVLVGAMLGFMGCSDDDGTPAPTQTILEIVQERANLSKLAAELERAQLNSTLSADGSITLFAPSNDAMSSLLNTLQLDDFSPVAEAVAQAVLTYHIANSEILSSGIVVGNTITTLEGESITIAAGPTLVSGATSASSIETADIKATNGVVHIVDVVLVPPSIGALIVKTLGSVAQPILLGSDFTTLSSALQKADAYAASESKPGLIDILAGKSTVFDAEQKLTVFAPSNGVFTKAGLTLDTFTGEQWYGILAHHIAVGLITSEDDFTVGGSFSTVATSPTTGLPKLTVLTKDAPTDPEVGILTGIALDSNGDTTPEGQIAVLNAAPAGNGTVHALAGFLTPQ